VKPRWTAILLTLATLVLAGCADDAEVGAPGTTTTTTTTPSSTTTTTADGPNQGIDDTAPPVTVETADDTVRAWVAALAEGDLEEAWGLTAEPSRVAIGGFEAFTDMRSALAEGFGAWAGTDNATFSIVPLETGGDEALSVVILRGTILQEGPAAPAADAVPVRTTAEGSLVEPFLDLGEVEHQPPPGTAIPADPTLVAFVPALRDVRFVFDDRGAETPATEGADGDQQRASLELGVLLEPGPHSLTVVLTTPEGEVATSTALYSVEG
jgi:hypothetical protein